MHLPSRVAGTLVMCLLGSIPQGCAHAPHSNTASLYPQALPDRAALISLMDRFVTAHRTCEFHEEAGVAAAAWGTCLGATSVWAVGTDPEQLGNVSVSIRQLRTPHNEFMLQAHHSSSGWAILSIWLIDA